MVLDPLKLQQMADDYAATNGEKEIDQNSPDNATPTSFGDQVKDVATTATTPSEYRGAAKAAVLGVPRGLVEGVRGALNFGTGIEVLSPAYWAGKAFGQDIQDQSFRAINDPNGALKVAADYYTPDAHTTGKAADAIGRLMEMPGQILAAGGNPEIMSAEAAMGTGTSLVDQGVPAGKAAIAGITAGVATEAGMKAPILGKTLPTRLASGAAIFPVINAAASAAQHKALSGTLQADQYNPWDVGARLTDLVTGGLFGGLHHLTAKPSEVDAALTLNNADHFQNRSAPGKPANAASVVAHNDAMEQALAQASTGDPVSVADKLQGASFIPRPTPDTAIHPNAPEVSAEPQSYVDYRRKLESNNGANIGSPAHAYGIDQFMPDTWRGIVKQEAPAWAHGLDDAQLLALRADPVKSGEMAAALDRQNTAALTAAGVPITDETLYAAHHFGARDAVKFANAVGDTPITSILPAKDIKANSYLAPKNADGVRVPLTKDQVIANWNHRAGTPGETPVAMGGEPSRAAEAPSAVDLPALSREVTSYDDAHSAAQEFVRQPISNDNGLVDATVSNATLGKMLSEKAASKSVNGVDHARAVANLDQLYKRGTLESTNPDARGEPTIAAIHRVVTEMTGKDGDPLTVRMTVKETTHPDNANPLYSVEAVDVAKPALRAPPEGGIERGPGQNRNSRQAGFGADSTPAAKQDKQAPNAPALAIAARVAQARPDFEVNHIDANGREGTVTLADAHTDIMDEHAQSTKDAAAYEAAVNCYMGVGA